MARRYVSLKEVASRAGVSFQTASKVLNGGSVRVSPDTATRIADAARELGYSPNSVARSLVRRSTMTIGLVAGSLHDPALAEFVLGAELAARQHGLSVLVSNLTDGAQEGADVVEALIERRVDGIVAAAPQLEEDARVADLLRRFVPAVSLHHVEGGGIPLVGSSHREVAVLALRHLLELGCRRIATVAGPTGRRVVRSRLRGAAEVIAAAGGEVDAGLAEADWTPGGAARATVELIEREPGLDAVFVHSDLMAVGVFDSLHRLGRRVPDDVAVVSCDDLAFAAYLRPSLSTIRLPFLDTGAAAVELLLRRVGGEPVPADPVLLPVELVRRDSTARQLAIQPPRKGNA